MDLKAQLSLARRHIARLSQLIDHPVYVEDMTENWLASLGARAVIFDHDGILGPNKSLGPDGTGVALLRRAVAVFGAGSVFVLSNTRATLIERRAHYEKHFQDVAYLTAKRKPEQDGVLQASWACGAPVEGIAVVDDGLLTGVLMALEAGAIAVYGLRREMEETAVARLIRLSTTAPQIIAVRVMACILG